MRTVVQLLAIGYVLGWVFGHPHWYIVLPLTALMTLIAGFAGAGQRAYRGQRIDNIASIWFSNWFVAAVGLFVVIRIHPWYAPQYAIPILRMILGNTLTGVSLGVERMMENSRRAATASKPRWRSARRAGNPQDAARQAVRAGMLPTLNQMAVVVVVSLPGMMTGRCWPACRRCRPCATRS